MTKSRGASRGRVPQRTCQGAPRIRAGEEWPFLMGGLGVGPHIVLLSGSCSRSYVRWAYKIEKAYQSVTFPLFVVMVKVPLARTESQVPSIRRATRGLRAMNSLCTPLCMNTWTAIDAAIGLESPLHLLCQVGIFSARLSGSTFAPARGSTRHRQHPTPHRCGILRLILSDGLIFQCCPCEKMPLAFLRMSCSCFPPSTSRVRRRTSSRFRALMPGFLGRRRRPALSTPCDTSGRVSAKILPFHKFGANSPLLLSYLRN